MVKFRQLTITLVFITASTLAMAGDFLFLNPPYLSETRSVINEAQKKAPAVFTDSETVKTFDGFASKLEEIVADKQRQQALKKVKPEDLEATKDAAFAKALNDFKDGLDAMAETTSKPLEQTLPSYNRWNRLETEVVKRGLEDRLAAYETRFGPDSEQVNILEFVISQKVLPGDEYGPAAWEPILRVTPVQLTSSGNGVTSSAQLGMNYYFVKGTPPTALKWMGISNHIGVAAAVQYLEEPGLFKYQGKPTFGVIFHLDRKEAGVMWDDSEDKLRLTLGYAFQFIPFTL